MTQLMTVDLLKQTLPKALQSNANQQFADKINSLAVDPEAGELIRENFLTYNKVLTEGKYKTEDYLNAITYASFKLMDYSNKDAYAKAFPDRYQALVARGASEKDISAYVAAYHKNKLVNSILEQAAIPVWLTNQGAYQKAINTQLDLMQNALSEKVRSDAANSILTHLKAPEVAKVQLDVNVKQEGGIAELRATMEQMAKQQLDMIRGGASARDIGRTALVIEAVDAEFTEVAPVTVPTPALPMPEPLAAFVPLPEPLARPAAPGMATVSLFAQQMPVDKPVDSGDNSEPEIEEIDFEEPEELARPTTRRPSLFDPMGSGDDA